MAQSYYCVNVISWLNATMTERKPQDQDKFVLRLPEGMRDRIKTAAERSGRSMNAEIVYVLELMFPAKPGGEDFTGGARLTQKQLDRFNQMLADLAEVAIRYCK